MARTVADRLERADDFFAGRSDVHRALIKIEHLLAEENIAYAVIGGMAMNVHGFRRFTNDVDLLTTSEGLEAIHRRVVGRGYQFDSTPKRLRDLEHGVIIDILVREGSPDPVERAGHHVLALPKLIDLKLTSGLAARSRIKDLADVQELIKALELPRDLGEQLDPSVRDEYYRLWDDAQNGYDPSA
jgi:hypothetical protein